MRFLSAIFFIFVWLFVPQSVLAEGEFATNYAVSYEVDASGVTSVSEDITLRNLTDQYFASDFSLTISAGQLNDLVASDKQGELEVVQEPAGGKTVVRVKFKQQVVGQDKEYKFNLRFKSPDFTQNRGEIWQVIVPKTPSLSKDDQFSLRLSVPVSFGDPTSIIPEPLSQRESGGKVSYTFDKSQLTQSGVTANFGSEQWVNFVLRYDLRNNGILPSIMQIPIPANTGYQQVLINQIQPLPENVTIDREGNYLAWFKVDQRQTVAVQVEGQAHLQLESNHRPVASADELADWLSRKRYWEVDNPAIKSRLEQIFSGQPMASLGASDKARLIGHYVANYLGFDRQRREAQDYARLGAVTAMNNPDTALSSEYSDLFVTLARAAGVPARRLEGYAYSDNAVLRPNSLGPDLHSWAEYYDINKGWVMVDPTWENTTGGADYVSRFDLDHLVLLTLGRSSELEYVWPRVEMNLSNGEFVPHREVEVSVESANHLISGWPLSITLRGRNIGNETIPISQFVISSQNLLAPLADRSIEVPAVPPFGRFNYDLALRGGRFWGAEDSQISVSWQGVTATKEIRVVPFYQNIGVMVGLVVFLIVTAVIYLSALTLHVKILRNH